MSEYHSHELPLEIYEDELRYILPETFTAAAADKGWDVSIEEGVDGNHYKVLYVMSRPVPIGFNDWRVADMRDRIGMVDENGQILDDYGLWAESVRTWRADEDRDFDPPASESKRLFFEFEGFPTDQTMDIIERLMESYPPETKPSRWLRLLGRLGIRKASPEA